ncbi:RdgB/HAM1 family non-canonical purine NTP pyrophosphatase [Bergeyella cardium]|uniref:dITP/XTP pyrophosphatase n=1 Tax=Bergeyella cardium TaxID=1585976 RepID=A0A6P1QX28_9FLAO|nr:RdgB/HAM1 family non-canonical purine NTP pyrophosphatase [Bergeyella cardium]QHN65697.1 RdgB/HAM1 family non-canonical purine NTP pyrophosphatase [Bergeyella cardium]WHE33286.1 RdgB/HAM1 family non-canonical purine NTP pyrophosphatase [Bergeyella cardium]WHF59935.1 RdgB/HAM1 family non-canonical purine NTP pyrophosphatase [Bergeyella cardium]
MELLVATHNQHKKDEIQQILGSRYTVKSLADYNLHDEIVEDGKTFEENALIKAKYCYEKTGIPSLGDDSGLAVEALNGKPGIYSARYAGDHNFEKNIAKVLEEMQGEENRNAHFITVLCYYDETGATYYKGEVYGDLLTENRGHKGFGYDPIFVPKGHSITFAEMPPEEKNKMSHRKKAIEKFLDRR